MFQGRQFKTVTNLCIKLLYRTGPGLSISVNVWIMLNRVCLRGLLGPLRCEGHQAYLVHVAKPIAKNNTNNTVCYSLLFTVSGYEPGYYITAQPRILNPAARLEYKHGPKSTPQESILNVVRLLTLIA